MEARGARHHHQGALFSALGARSKKLTLLRLYPLLAHLLSLTSSYSFLPPNCRSPIPLSSTRFPSSRRSSSVPAARIPTSVDSLASTWSRD